MAGSSGGDVPVVVPLESSRVCGWGPRFGGGQAQGVSGWSWGCQVWGSRGQAALGDFWEGFGGLTGRVPCPAHRTRTACSGPSATRAPSRIPTSCPPCPTSASWAVSVSAPGPVRVSVLPLCRCIHPSSCPCVRPSLCLCVCPFPVCVSILPPVPVHGVCVSIPVPFVRPVLSLCSIPHCPCPCSSPPCLFLCPYPMLSPSLCPTLSLSPQVRRTTATWFGSGCTRARPSAAPPVVPTTNSSPTSCPTEGPPNPPNWSPLSCPAKGLGDPPSLPLSGSVGSPESPHKEFVWKAWLCLCWGWGGDRGA